MNTLAGVLLFMFGVMLCASEHGFWGLICIVASLMVML